MSALFHRCNAIGCTRNVPANLFMCGQHWKMVPRKIQRRIVAAWTTAMPPSLEWCRAADEAVAHLAASATRKRTVPSLTFIKAFHPEVVDT